MFTIIGGDGSEYGPAGEEQIRAWIAGGRANLDTRARREGDEEWQRLGAFPEFNRESASNAPTLTPSEQAAGSQPIKVDPKAFADDLISRAQPLAIGSCLERSWHLLRGNFWPLVGATALSFVIMVLVNLMPVLGGVASLLLTGVFYGGLYYFFLKRIRGQTAEISEVFCGFSLAFAPLMLTGLVASLLTLVGILLLILPGIYLSVAYAFNTMLAIDKRLDFWPALEVSRRVITAQWFRFFGLTLLCGLVIIVGFLCLGIGVFVAMPITFGAIAFAYEDLCNPPPR